ncbi:Replication protein A DNA-binding subunit [Zea mays]|uniref:Replication protein A DNA-binding subunit n=1 Tax=Zea mays TaxID=4577 RepID=A0A3L6DBY4_MAIZE|nr:Replication protein A DNA-binding subunit [Zea mays]
MFMPFLVSTLQMGDVLIPSLQCGNLFVTICVRVSRFWDFSDPQDDARLLHCDMVLLDEEGNSIHATIYPPFIEKFRPLIKEGSVYNMTYFRVRASNNLYKPVPNDIMITFTNWTKLEQVIEIPPAFPTLTYSLTHIEQIHSRVDHKDYYTGMPLG